MNPSTQSQQQVPDLIHERHPVGVARPLDAVVPAEPNVDHPAAGDGDGAHVRLGISRRQMKRVPRVDVEDDGVRHLLMPAPWCWLR